jgi:hypothetical protein
MAFVRLGWTRELMMPSAVELSVWTAEEVGTGDTVVLCTVPLLEESSSFIAARGLRRVNQFNWCSIQYVVATLMMCTIMADIFHPTFVIDLSGSILVLNSLK